MIYQALQYLSPHHYIYSMSGQQHLRKANRHVNHLTKGLPDHQVKRLTCIGAFIRGLRLADCKSQIEAAHGMGMARQTVQTAEYGGNITLLTMFKIIDAYDMTLEEFFTEMK